jgi:hypothetical protein
MKTRNEDPYIANRIRELIRETTGRHVPNVEPWPGCPINHFPLMFAPTLNAMIASGEVEVVSRPSVVNPNRVAKFVRFPRP